VKLKAIGFSALAFCAIAHADDGLVVHFTIKKTAGTQVNSYTNGVLIRLTEASDITFPGQYEMHLESRDMGNGEVNLVVTLKDLTSGKPVYAGSGAATVKVGAFANVSFHQLQQASAKYEVFLDTSYGELPQPSH
jgi:hypothetical protein